MLSPKAQKQVMQWLELPYEVVVEWSHSPQGVVWERVISKPPTKASTCTPTLLTSTSARSMHTHPRACYDRNGTYYGWPSGSDYATFLDQRGEEHIVCALEGFYHLESTPSTVQAWHRLSEKKKDAYVKEWDVPSTTRDFTPDDALRALQARMGGWITVTMYKYAQ